MLVVRYTEVNDDFRNRWAREREKKVFILPFLELFAMRIIFDAADHKVCEVAVLVGYDVDETVCCGG